MTILDKLIEKKDLMTYINVRIEHLSKDMRKTILSTPKEDREKVKQRMVGRIKELKVLKDCVHRNDVKEMSKHYWKKNKEAENEK